MGTPDHNLSTDHQQPGDAKRPSDTLDRDTPERTGTDPDKGSPAKGAHRMGDQGGDRAPGTPRMADPGFATNGE